MARTIRFHLDENIHHGITDALRRHGVDVTSTPEENLRGASDEEQLGFSNSQSRVLFTHDQDFLKLDGKGAEHSGIIYCNQQTHSMGEIIQMLLLIWEIYEADELRGHVEYL